MDPNEILANLRELVTADEPDGDVIAAAFDSLDTWLTRGGFLPADWTRKA